jgi:glucuronoarabinoxylan endo-1,4-beta-xylanase
MKKWLSFVLLFVGPLCYAQSATIDWSTVHQQIDGFGSSVTHMYTDLTPTQRNIVFGTGAGDLGFSIIRIGINNGDEDGASSCTSVSSSCAGPYSADVAAAASNGGRVYASAFSPPAAYTTNGSTICQAGSGSGTLASSHYGDFATWIANWVQSVHTYYSGNPTVYAISIQNEPDYCASYDSSVYSPSQFDSFIKNDLGPTFHSNGLSTLIFLPESGRYSDLSSYGATCAIDSGCASYIGGFNFHDYDAYLSNFITSADPYPSGWPAAKYWQTEASCGSGSNNFCDGSIFDASMTNALNWASVIDQRMQDGANAWLYWWTQINSNIGEALICTVSACGTLDANGEIIASRAYVIGQYARFIRPGYYRISATHTPQAGISVSAYRISRADIWLSSQRTIRALR